MDTSGTTISTHSLNKCSYPASIMNNERRLAILPESPCTKHVYCNTLLMVVSQRILKCHFSKYLYQFLKFQSGSYLTPMSFLFLRNRYQRYNNIHTFLKQMFLPCIHYGHERRLACKSQFNHVYQFLKFQSGSYLTPMSFLFLRF
jgi:hypothetical protein